MNDKLNRHELCNLFEPCLSPEAPLCPLREETISNGAWYPDQEICSSPRYSNLAWIKKQRLIAMKLTRESGSFTVPMLNELKRVEKGLKGVDFPTKETVILWLEENRDLSACLSAVSKKTKQSGIDSEIRPRLF